MRTDMVAVTRLHQPLVTVPGAPRATNTQTPCQMNRGSEAPNTPTQAITTGQISSASDTTSTRAGPG